MDALDVLLGHVEVLHRTVMVDGEVRQEARVGAVDRHGEEKIYANWCEPVKLIDHRS